LSIAAPYTVPWWRMSERSIYLRDQAAKCRAHARSMTDVTTQTVLRKLAAEYVVQADELERKENS
jgi:hypothetical protein